METNFLEDEANEAAKLRFFARPPPSFPDTSRVTHSLVCDECVANYDALGRVLRPFFRHVWSVSLHCPVALPKRPFVCSRTSHSQTIKDGHQTSTRGTTQFATPSQSLLPPAGGGDAGPGFVGLSAGWVSVLGRGQGSAALGATTLRGSAAVARRPVPPTHLHHQFLAGRPLSFVASPHPGTMARQPSPLPCQRSQGPQSGWNKTRNKYECPKQTSSVFTFRQESQEREKAVAHRCFLVVQLQLRTILSPHSAMDGFLISRRV